jgi:hypothetical protein
MRKKSNYPLKKLNNLKSSTPINVQILNHEHENREDPCSLTLNIKALNLDNRIRGEASI